MPDESAKAPEEMLKEEPVSTEPEIQPVEKGFAQKLEEQKEAPKVLGEFNSEDEARAELLQLRDFASKVIQDKEYQALLAARRQAELEYQKKILAMQEDEERLLGQYAEAIKQGDPAKAVLTLVRSIRAQAYNDAQAAIRNELTKIQKPIYDKAQLLENQALVDLHPLADDAVWLAQKLEPLGVPKKDIAEFMRRVGAKYALANHDALAQFRQKAMPQRGAQKYAQLEEPSADAGWAGVDDKTFDKWIDQFWQEAGY